MEHLEWPGFQRPLAHGKAAEEAVGSLGLRRLGRHCGGPCNSGGIVTVNDGVDVFKGVHAGFEDIEVEEDRHFQIGVCQSSLRVGGGDNGLLDVWRPLQPPNLRSERALAAEPDSTGPKGRRVAVTIVVRQSGNEFFDVRRPAGEVEDHGTQV